MPSSRIKDNLWSNLSREVRLKRVAQKLGLQEWLRHKCERVYWKRPVLACSLEELHEGRETKNLNSIVADLTGPYEKHKHQFAHWTLRLKKYPFL